MIIRDTLNWKWLESFHEDSVVQHRRIDLVRCSHHLAVHRDFIRLLLWLQYALFCLIRQDSLKLHYLGRLIFHDERNGIERPKIWMQNRVRAWGIILSLVLYRLHASLVRLVNYLFVLGVMLVNTADVLDEMSLIFLVTLFLGWSGLWIAVWLWSHGCLIVQCLVELQLLHFLTKLDLHRFWNLKLRLVLFLCEIHHTWLR